MSGGGAAGRDCFEDLAAFRPVAALPPAGAASDDILAGLVLCTTTGSLHTRPDCRNRSPRSSTVGSVIDAVRRVAIHAEAKDHHPDIDIRWRTVTFVLVTHSEGGITDKDVAMAEDINGLVV